MAVLNAYLDESGTHASSGSLCSAGYVFDVDGAKRFSDEMRPVLQTAGLDYIHATEHQCRSDSAELFTTLRDITDRTSMRGFLRFALRDDLDRFNNSSQLARFSGDCYTLLTLACMEAIARYAKERDATVWYHIESGPHKYLNALLEQIGKDDDLRNRYAFHASTFLGKTQAIQLQSADLLAWSFFRTWNERVIPGITDFPAWKNWYYDTGKHDLKGFTFTGLETLSLANRINGVSLP